MIILVFNFSFASQAWIFTIAILMMSAALPWIGALIALRSAKPRVVMFLELMSRKYLLRPRIVSTYSFSLAKLMLSSMYRLMPGNSAKYESMISDASVFDILRFWARPKAVLP